MQTRLIAAGLALVVGIVIVLTTWSDGADPCVGSPEPACATTHAPTIVPTGGSAPPSTQPILTPGASPSSPATPAPSATPPVYTFRDEFTGSKLKSAWGRHWPGFGATLWSASQVSVGDGVLTIKARKSGSKWVGGLIDTVGKFTQRYGVFSARMRFTEGAGLWPAFWLAQPQNKAREEAEIDVMEVCAHPPGGHNGNDVTLLHHYVHKIDGSHAFAFGYRTDNLSGDWHVYTVDWRKDRMTFYFDGLETSTFTFASDADVSDMKMAVVLDLAVGGRFCGASDATTPNPATLEVDWVRVTE